jgi:hypothetical protein
MLCGKPTIDGDGAVEFSPLERLHGFDGELEGSGNTV